MVKDEWRVSTHCSPSKVTSSLSYSTALIEAHEYGQEKVVALDKGGKSDKAANKSSYTTTLHYSM